MFPPPDPPERENNRSAGPDPNNRRRSDAVWRRSSKRQKANNKYPKILNEIQATNPPLSPESFAGQNRDLSATGTPLTLSFPLSSAQQQTTNYAHCSWSRLFAANQFATPTAAAMAPNTSTSSA